MDWKNYYGYHRRKNVIRIIRQAEAQGCKPMHETLDEFKWNEGKKKKRREYRLWIHDGLWSLCSAG